MMKTILEAETRSDDEQIKIAESRSNMSAKIFEVGDSMDVLFNEIKSKIKKRNSRSDS